MAVADKFTITCADARVIWLGNRSALSIVAGAAARRKSSTYVKSFKQGATIVPRNMYFVTVDGLEGRPDPSTTYHAATNEAVAKDSKRPYQDVRLQGQVEGRFIFSTTLAANILPFALREPLSVLLPIEESNGVYYTLTVSALRRKGHREFARWMERAEHIWAEKRGAKAAAQTLLQRLDYQRGLTAQSPKHRHLVLYNAAGTSVSATYCDRELLTLPLIVEHKVYWAALSTPAEAHYLTAILNASVVNELIKPFQSTGLLGERDIEKKLLDVPIPVFNHENTLHTRLSALGTRAYGLARSALENGAQTPRRSLARSRALMRETLKDVLTQIDDAVRELLA